MTGALWSWTWPYLPFVALTLGFLLDMMQLRGTLPDERVAAFSSAWKRAFVKYALSAGALAYLGLRAMRMIPARSRQRTPKTVHVVSK